MSEGKTYIPGVSNDYSADDFGGLYTRSGDSGGDSQRTYVPGVGEQTPASAAAPMPTDQTATASRPVTMQERVAVGALFSVSRTAMGELFPLYLGKNIIGQTPNCDIVLRERTVSPAHAILYVHKTDMGLEASITDFNSSYGTRVDSMDARYEPVAVRNDSVLTIGSHYRFLVKFFDMDRQGLAEDPNFEAMPQIGAPVNAPVVNNNVADDDFYRASSSRDSSSDRTVIYK